MRREAAFAFALCQRALPTRSLHHAADELVAAKALAGSAGRSPLSSAVTENLTTITTASGTSRRSQHAGHHTMSFILPWGAGMAGAFAAHSVACQDTAQKRDPPCTVCIVAFTLRLIAEGILLMQHIQAWSFAHGERLHGSQRSFSVRVF